MTSINQKEYLKKYLGIGKNSKEKRKKKKEKSVGNRLKVVDEDLDVAVFQEIQDDLSAANEDAPQIVAIIDDRPPSLRIDEETKSNLWKPIGEPSDVKDSKVTMKMGNSFKLNSMNKYSLKSGSHQRFKKPYSKPRDDSVDNVHNRSKIDQSPPWGMRAEELKLEKHKIIDHSPPRKIKRSKAPPKPDKDLSPQRNEDRDFSPIKTRHSDMSPTRRNEGFSPPSKNRYTDLSPTRTKNSEHRKRDEDNSPPRRTITNDLSPPRRDVKRPKADADNSPPSETSRDLSPPRNKRRDEDVSFSRKQKSPDQKCGFSYDRLDTRKYNVDRDNSPPRKVSRDLSPPRKRNRERSESPRRSSLPDRIKKERETPVPESKQRKSRWTDSSSISSDGTDKIEKTLSGKRAGLQDARGITQELMALKEKEDELFRNMSDELSGANATTIVRGKKPIDLEEQAIQKMKQKEMKEKYDRWGKGIKQVDDQNQKFAEQLHEMSKPLARYADDEDLEKYLKDQEREGDPMLAYIRKKKRKKAVETGIPEKPQYMGEFMPNRFGIVPGYRWDGVDRSNGYERKWFETQNKKRALQEEAHKWSTEDM